MKKKVTENQFKIQINLPFVTTLVCQGTSVTYTYTSIVYTYCGTGEKLYKHFAKTSYYERIN